MKWHTQKTFLLIFLVLASWLSVFHFMPLVHAAGNTLIYDGNTSTALDYEGQRKVLQNPRGLGYCYVLFYIADSSYDLMLYKSETGSSWSSEAIIKNWGSDIFGAASFTFREDAANSRLVVYFSYGDSSGNIYYTYGTIADDSSTITLGDEQSITTASYQPTIICDQNGYVWIVYESYDGTHYDVRCEVTTTINPLNTPTWSSYNTVYDDTTTTTHKYLTAVAGNTSYGIAVVWINNVLTMDSWLKGRYQTWNGATFTNGTIQTENQVYINQPISIVADRQDTCNIIILFSEENIDCMWYIKWDIAGSFGTASEFLVSQNAYTLSLTIEQSSHTLIGVYRAVSTGFTNFGYKTSPTPDISWSVETQVNMTEDSADYLAMLSVNEEATGKVLVVCVTSTLYKVEFTSISTVPDVPEHDYVDSQTDVDSHADHGTHSSFASQKATDWTNDTLIEANTNTTVSNNSENFVDNNSSDVDTHTGHGTSSNFTAQQDANVLYNDTLTEANMGGTPSTFGNTTAMNATGSSIENQITGSWFTTGATGGYAKSIVAYLTCTTTAKWAKTAIYNWTADNDVGALVGNTSEQSLPAQSGYFWRTFTFEVEPFLAPNTKYFLLAWSYLGTGIAQIGRGAATAKGVYKSSTTYGTWPDPITGESGLNYECSIYCNMGDPANYELDYEFSWTTADYDETSEYLCIRTNSFTGTAENLGVDVWDGSWKSISNALTASQWNNISISTNLTGATIYFRFIGKTETTDPNQNTWGIECSLIHTWSAGVNYELDLEEQFTTANFSRTSVELCVRMGAYNTSEQIRLDYWNASASAWVVAVASLTTNVWNNVSVKAYTSNASVTFTVRFVGVTESGDLERSAWDKDACLLHTWDGGAAAGLTAVLSASTLIPSTLQFLKELSFQGTQSTNILVSLINNKAVPFSLGSVVDAISSVTQSLALAFTATGLTRLFGSLDFAKSLSFSHSGLVNVAGSLQNWQAKGYGLDGLVKALDYSAFNKGLLFSQTGTVKALESLSIAKALGLSFSELPKLFGSSSLGRALAFSVSDSGRLFDASALTKAYGFSFSNLMFLFDSGTSSKEIAVMVTSFLASDNAQLLDSLNIGKAFGFSQSGSIQLFDSSTMLKGLGFLSTNALNVFGSASFGRELGFFNVNSLSLFGSNGVGNALSFGLSGIANAWGSLGVTQAHGFGLSNTLNAWTALVTNKGMGFSLSQLVSIRDYGSGVFEISVAVAKSFDLSGVVYAFDSGFFNKATGFLTTNTVNVFGSNAWNNAFGFSVTNALKPLDYTLVNKGLGFLNTNTLSTYSTVDIGRSLGFSTSQLIRLLDTSSLGRSLGFTATNTLQVLGASQFNKAFGFIMPNSLNMLGSLTLQRALGFRLTDMVRVFDFSGQAQSPSFILSTLLKVFDASQLNRALGFGSSEVVRVFDYSIFTKALGFSNPETFKAFGSLQFGKALGFSTSELTRLFDSSGFGRSLAFSSANSLRIFDANLVNKALGFTAQNSINLFSLNSINKGLGFSLPEVAGLWVSITTAYQIYGGTNYPFTLSELTRIFDTGLFNKATGFITSNSLDAWSSNFWNNAFGFQATSTLRLWDLNSIGKALAFGLSNPINVWESSLFGKGLAYLTTNTLRTWDTSSLAKALGFSTSNSLHTWATSISNVALGFNPTSILTLSSTNVFNKAIDFQEYGLIQLFESLSYSFEIFQYIPQERTFIVTGLMQIFDNLLPTKALAFTSTSTLRLFDYGTSLRAFGYTVTNSLQGFESLIFLKALQFTTTNSLYPTAANAVVKALSFSLTDLTRLFDLATFNKANLYTSTETLLIHGSVEIGKSLTFLNDATVNILSNLEFNKEITIWFFEISELSHVFAHVDFSSIAVPVPANAALVLGMFGALMSFIAFAFVLVHRRRGEDED